MSPSLDVVVPVLNEERDLSPSVVTLHDFLSRSMADLEWRIVIADNGSTDATRDVARQLSERFERVVYTRLEERGRGRALRRTWLESEAEAVCYMDVDLSSDLAALPDLVRAVQDDGYDIAIGSRLTRGALVIGRPPQRELTSRAYNLIVRAMFFMKVRDAQCGFKAVSRRAAREIVPLVKDTGWFFDTELLVLAEKNGYRIKEVPVRWTDDPDSRVKIISTAIEDMKGLLRLRFGGLRKASKRLAEKGSYIADGGD